MISTGELVPVLFQIQTRVTTEVGEGDTVRSTFQGCPAFWHLWATLEEELSWATH